MFFVHHKTNKRPHTYEVHLSWRLPIETRLKNAHVVSFRVGGLHCCISHNEEELSVGDRIWLTATQASSASREGDGESAESPSSESSEPQYVVV